METIQWFLNGKKVGESELTEHSTQEIRHNLAFKAGVKEFDNFVFFKDGEFRLSANEVLFENKGVNTTFDRLGIIEGKAYQKVYPNGYAIH